MMIRLSSTSPHLHSPRMPQQTIQILCDLLWCSLYTLSGACRPARNERSLVLCHISSHPHLLSSYYNEAHLSSSHYSSDVC